MLRILSPRTVLKFIRPYNQSLAYVDVEKKLDALDLKTVEPYKFDKSQYDVKEIEHLLEKYKIEKNLGKIVNVFHKLETGRLD